MARRFGALVADVMLGRSADPVVARGLLRMINTLVRPDELMSDVDFVGRVASYFAGPEADTTELDLLRVRRRDLLAHWRPEERGSTDARPGHPRRHDRRRHGQAHPDRRHRRGRQRDHGGRPGRRRGAARHRRRWAAGDAGLGGRPHALRRPSHLGPRGVALRLARRDHRRHGQLRRRLRAGTRDRSRVAHPADGGCRGHPRHCVGRGHELELGNLRRVPRRGRAHRAGARRRQPGAARRPAGLRAGGGPGQRHRHGGRDRRDGGHCARGGARRGDRRLHDAHRVTPGQGRRIGGRDHGGGGRARRDRRGAGQGGPPRLLTRQRHARP